VPLTPHGLSFLYVNLVAKSGSSTWSEYRTESSRDSTNARRDFLSGSPSFYSQTTELPAFAHRAVIFGDFVSKVNATGKIIESPFALILNVTDGKITRFQMFHLKNFGIVYDDVLGEARLAPVYDLVTTSIYLPKDSLALTLNGTTQWPDSKFSVGSAKLG
jgi:hypothetical protein